MKRDWKWKVLFCVFWFEVKLIDIHTNCDGFSCVKNWVYLTKWQNNICTKFMLIEQKLIHKSFSRMIWVSMNFWMFKKFEKFLQISMNVQRSKNSQHSTWWNENHSQKRGEGLVSKINYFMKMKKFRIKTTEKYFKKI